MSHDKAISVLNNLIETTKDGEKGFKTAAEGLTAPDIKHRFLQVLTRARTDDHRAAG